MSATSGARGPNQTDLDLKSLKLLLEELQTVKKEQYVALHQSTVCDADYDHCFKDFVDDFVVKFTPPCPADASVT